MSKVALVTGANRGIGFEVAKELAEKGFEVIMTARDEKKGRVALGELKNLGLNLHFHKLDVTSPKEISDLMKFIENKFKRLDVLVNNAGIFPDEDFDTSPFDTTIDLLKEGMETNVYGPFELCRLAIPLMRKNGYGRIVNVSSGMGQLSTMTGKCLSYRMSKTALNVVTKIFAGEVKGENILINSASPGWVKTDMGGPEAERSLEEGADTLVWLATSPDGSPSGKFFRDREIGAW